MFRKCVETSVMSAILVLRQVPHRSQLTCELQAQSSLKWTNSLVGRLTHVEVGNAHPATGHV